MKKMILLVGAATLAACSANSEEAADDTSTDVAEVEATEAAAEGPGMPGNYVVYDADGTERGSAVYSADGTYEWTGADGEVESGTWENRDGAMCNEDSVAAAEGEEDMGPVCWTPGETDEDGRTIWTADRDGEDGEPATAHVEYTAA